MAVEPGGLSRRLAAVADDASAALRGYRQLAEETSDPTAHVILVLIARDAEQDNAFLRRINSGALEAIDAPTAWCLCDQTTGAVLALATAARTHADQLRLLACSERHVGRGSRAIRLDALADNSDKHAALLAELAHHQATRSGSGKKGTLQPC